MLLAILTKELDFLSENCLELVLQKKTFLKQILKDRLFFKQNCNVCMFVLKQVKIKSINA